MVYPHADDVQEQQLGPVRYRPWYNTVWTVMNIYAKPAQRQRSWPPEHAELYRTGRCCTPWCTDDQGQSIRTLCPVTCPLEWENITVMRHNGGLIMFNAHRYTVNVGFLAPALGYLPLCTVWYRCP